MAIAETRIESALFVTSSATPDAISAGTWASTTVREPPAAGTPPSRCRTQPATSMLIAYCAALKAVLIGARRRTSASLTAPVPANTTTAAPVPNISSAV